MDICLSSGSTPQYKRDILRAIESPAGAWLQFRYRKTWLSADVQRAVLSRPFLPRPAIIAYVDQTNSSKQPEFVPLRSALITDVASHGTTVSLQLELGDFVFDAAHTAEFNSFLQSFPDSPHWIDGKTKGLYWLASDGCPKLPRVEDLTAFEQIIDNVGNRSDFATESLFVYLRQICDLDRHRRVTASRGEFALKPNGVYDIHVYQFHPRDMGKGMLEFASGTPHIAFRSNERLEFTSRYDFRRLSFTVGSPLLSLAYLFSFPEERRVRTPRGTISVSRVSTQGIDARQQKDWDLDLRFQIEPDSETTIMTGVFAGILIAVPSAITLASTGKWNWPAAVVIFGASVLAGIFAVIGIKKPL